MPGATFDLVELQTLMREDHWVATWEAQAHAVQLELDAEADIRTCVLALDEADFYKSMESTGRPGTFQDVYKPTYEGRRLYLKLRLQVLPQPKVVVIQFKRDQSK